MTTDPLYERQGNLYTSIQRLETRRNTRFQLRIFGTGLIAVAGILFWGWYTIMEGGLLLFPSSARECKIADLKEPGHCRIMATLTRSFSIREIFGQEIAFKATDETGSIDIRTFVKAEETDHPVEIVGALRKFKTGVRLDAVWIAGKFSWLLILELTIPAVSAGLGILLILLSFSQRPDRSLERISQGTLKKPLP